MAANVNAGGLADTNTKAGLRQSPEEEEKLPGTMQSGGRAACSQAQVCRDPATNEFSNRRRQAALLDRDVPSWTVDNEYTSTAAAMFVQDGVAGGGGEVKFSTSQIFSNFSNSSTKNVMRMQAGSAGDANLTVRNDCIQDGAPSVRNAAEATNLLARAGGGTDAYAVDSVIYALSVEKFDPAYRNMTAEERENRVLGVWCADGANLPATIVRMQAGDLANLN